MKNLFNPLRKIPGLQTGDRNLRHGFCFGEGASAFRPRGSTVKCVMFNAILLYTLHFTLYTTAYAQSVSSTELISNAKLYDGKAIIYEGEVVGDIMVRGEYAWINVNDGQNAIGIWADKNLTKDISFTGSYKSKGEWLEINGIFQRACLGHGGDLDIHALAIRKIRPGRQTIERLNVSKKNQVFVLLGVLCLVWVLKLLK